jgi:transposase
MRYELSDCEWTDIKPLLPNKPRGVRRVNDRRHLLGPAFGCPVARPAGELRSPHHLLQSVRSVAANVFFRRTKRDRRTEYQCGHLGFIHVGLRHL